MGFMNEEGNGAGVEEVVLRSSSQARSEGGLGTVACQGPLSVEFSRQASWSGLPFTPPGDLPKLGIKPMSIALAGGFFTTSAI